MVDGDSNAINSGQVARSIGKSVKYTKKNMVCDFFNFALHLKAVTVIKDNFV